MRAVELLEYKIEKVYDDYHDIEINVAVNPTWQILRNLLKRTDYGELRAYYSNGKFYFWDAAELIHAPMVKLLELPYSDANRLTLQLRRDDEIELDHSDAMKSVYKQDPYINRNFNIEDHDWEEITLKGAVQ